MAHKLTPISWRILVKKLKALGFEGPYHGGKHPYMVRGDVVLTIPNPHRGTIGIDLLVRILKQAGVRKDEWLDIDK